MTTSKTTTYGTVIDRKDGTKITRHGSEAEAVGVYVHLCLTWPEGATAVELVELDGNAPRRTIERTEAEPEDAATAAETEQIPTGIPGLYVTAPTNR